MADRLRIGIIGCGVVGAAHAAALAGVDEAHLVAVADNQPAAAEALAAKHDTDWYGDYRDLLARDDIDLVTVGTPSGLHAQMACDAARAAKHVLVEKPMALTLTDADRMIAASREAGVKLGVIFQKRFIRSFARLHDAAQMGQFGRLVLAQAVVPWYRTPEYYAGSGWRGTWALDGGGALINQSIHSVDMLQWCMGPVVRVSAQIATLRHCIEAEDTFVASLVFKSGALGVIAGTTAAWPGFPVRLAVYGDRGGGVLEGQNMIQWETGDGEAVADLAGTIDPAPEDPWWLPHRALFRATCRAILDGQPVPVSSEEGRKALEIVRAIYRSAWVGQSVALPLEHDRWGLGAEEEVIQWRSD